MKYLQQEPQKPAHETVKKYLTNSEKSIYNLTWQVGGRAQEYYIRSRTPSPLDRIKGRPDRSIKERNARKFWQPPQHEARWKGPEKSRSMPNMPKSKTAVSEKQLLRKSTRLPHSSTNPSLPAHEKTSEQLSKSRERMPRTTTKSRVKPNKQSSSQAHHSNDLTIEQYYVNSSAAAQRVIDDLRRRGFIEAGIESPAVRSQKNKKKYGDNQN